MDVLFSRSDLHVVGINREPLPFECIVRNVDTENLTKLVSYFEPQAQLNEEGYQLYLLPQEPEVVEKEVLDTVITTEETDRPVMVTKLVKIPLLDEDGNQVRYETTYIDEVVEKTDVPVMITVYDEETGESTEVHKTDEDGNLLYYGEVRTGVFTDCFTTEVSEVHDADVDGNLLYYKDEVIDTIQELIEKDPIILTELDEQYVEGLAPLMVDVENFKMTTFSEQSDVFTYEDVVQHKYLGIVNDSQLDELIVELFTDESKLDLDNNQSVNTGFGFANILPNGKLTLKPYELSELNDTFRLLELETSGNVEVYLNDVLFVDNQVSVEPTDYVSITIKNPSDVEVDITSIAIGL